MIFVDGEKGVLWKVIYQGDLIINSLLGWVVIDQAYNCLVNDLFLP